MVVNINDKDIILSDAKNEKETKSYIESLRNFYNINETIIESESFDIDEFNDGIIQIIPQEKKNKFDKNKFTILQIEI